MVTFTLVAGLTVFMSGQQNSMHVPIFRSGPQGPALEHVVEDWTHHHLVFSNPGTEDEAIRNGNYEEWRRIVNEPRYLMQQVRRRAPAQGPFADEVARINELARANAAAGPGAAGAQPELNNDGFRFGELAKPTPSKKKPNGLRKDWNVSFGTTTAPANTVFPAKWSFDTTTASCANDFVIFPTGQAGSASKAGIIAYYNLYSGCGSTVPAVDWAYNTNGGTISLSPVFSGDGSQVAFIQSSSSVASLVLLKYPSTIPGGTGTLSSPTALTTTARTVSGGVHTTSGSTNLTSSTGNFVSTEVGASISGTNIAPGSTVAAFISSTSITLSLNATGTSTTGSFTIQDFTSTVVSPTSYSGCTAPCMTSITLNAPVSATTAPNDALSNPWYDYTSGSDTLYVGADNGTLHKFHPVFGGTPAEVTTSPWPVTLNASYDPSSPVYDSASGCVYVGDTGGFLYSVNSGAGLTTNVCGSSAGKYTASSQLDNAFGLRDGPLVDSTAKMVYVFTGCGTGTNCSSTSSNTWTGAPAVWQFTTDFTGQVSRTVGTGANASKATAYQLVGTFDNTYYSSSNQTGNLYVCTTNDQATLYQVPISGNATQTPVVGPNLAASTIYGRCSPQTEFYNTTTTAATGSVTIITDPAGSGWGTTKTVTIGSTTYTFVTTVGSISGNVLKYTSGTAALDEQRTAQNLNAAITKGSTCYGGGSSCYDVSAANASVTTSYTTGTAVVSLTAATPGTAGDFNPSTNYSTGITVSGGTNGTGPTDYLFVSVYEGLPTGCTGSADNGCLMAYDITTPSGFGTGITPVGVMNVVSTGSTYTPPTGGFIIDNLATSPTGASQIYFLTTYTTGTTLGSNACAGICGVQASQSSP